MTSFTRIKNGTSAELVAYKKNRVISLILLSFAGVIYGFGSDINFHTEFGRNLATTFYPSGLAIFIYCASIFCLFSACTGSFKDMHDRPSADVQMSMPLSSTERYLSRLMMIGNIWYFPFIISALAGTFIATVVHYHEAVGAAAVIISTSLKYLIVFMAATLFIISVTVLCQCCTGSKAESKYTPVLLMLVLSLAPVFVYEMNDKFGTVSCDKSFERIELWTFSEIFTYDPDEPEFVIFALVNCLISAAVIFGSMYIYKKRDARSVGMPVCFPLFLELTVFVSLMMLFSLVHSYHMNGVVFFLSWLATIILRIVTSRKSFSFKKTGIWTLLFAAYYIVFLIVVFFMFKTGGFGSLYRKTDLEPFSNKSVEVLVSINEEYTYFTEREVIMAGNIRYANRGVNRNVTEAFMNTSAEYIKKSAKTKGLFASQMFGLSTSGALYDCRITISTYDPDKSWRTDNIYSADFMLSREEAINLKRSLEGTMDSVSGYAERKDNRDNYYDYYGYDA